MSSTPKEIIAKVSLAVTSVVDRITGDRVDYPLLVAHSTLFAMKNLGIDGTLMYGAAAWIEIREDQTPIWAGCWGQNVHFWVASQFSETIDLNASVAHRKQSHDQPNQKTIYSPPILWSREIPKFYRYKPEGIAELELTEERDLNWKRIIESEITRVCKKEFLDPVDPEFPNEPILCPNRLLLDDSKTSFKLYDRALGVHGIPEAPF